MFGGLAEIVMRAKAGDAQAFDYLYFRFRRRVVGQLLRLGLNLPEAEDLCQEVFLQVRKKLFQLRIAAAFPGWLRQTARRMGINAITRQKWREVTLTDLLSQKPDLSVSTASENAIRAEQKRQVVLALAALRPMDKESLLAFYWGGYSLIEMSEIFKAPVGTIKRRLHVARKRFKKEAEKYGIGADGDKR